MKGLMLVLGILLPLISAQNCNLATQDRVDCGFIGIDENGCSQNGCCWDSNVPQGVPWCYFGASACDDSITWSGASDIGFTQSDYDTMYANYKANINVEGCGAVCAAPDRDIGYYYNWMRDAGLSIKTWLDINSNDLDTVRTELDAYVGWVDTVQHKTDFNVDVRVEPKFEIPSGDPYAGGWCRPQTDGPALRAMALAQYGLMKNDAGEDTSFIWDRVKFDLEWVLGNWASSGCDLWEEVTSDNFYWNRMGYVYSLNKAADFADAIGESSTATQYRNTANNIKPTADAHYSGGYIYESDNRMIDSAVLHAIATFGEYGYNAASQAAAETLDVYTKAFCKEYPINEADVNAGLPGLLVGRYPGDTYQGGNPWQLLTAVMAEVFYKGGTINYKSILEKGNTKLTEEEHGAWIKLLKLEEDSSLYDLAVRQAEAGDATLQRLHSYVQADGMRIDEQIDKFNGGQKSAQGLTWSYANILHAMKEEENARSLRVAVEAKLATGN